MGDLRRPGCYDQPRPTEKDGYYVKTRFYNRDGTYDMLDEWVPFRNSQQCMNDHRHPHPECEGCQHRRTQ